MDAVAGFLVPVPLPTINASATVTRLFPHGAVASELQGPLPRMPIPAEERPAVSRANEQRRREFAAGRACARHALAQLGHAPCAMPSSADRAPAWPQGTLGSISHCRGYVAAVAAQRGEILSLGLDLECSVAVDHDLIDEICTGAELDWIGSLPDEERRHAGSLLFCAKEAFFKCQFPLTGRWLEFNEVSLRLGAGEIGVESDADLGGYRWSGRYAVIGGHVLSGFAALARAG